MAEQDQEHETLGGMQAEEDGYRRTKAILGAIEAGMTEEQIDAALEGRGVIPATGEQRRTCDWCGMPTSPRMLMSSAHGSVCPDCYDAANE